MPETTLSSSRSSTRQALGLAALLVLQSLAAVFFVVDVVQDISESGFDTHVVLETLVTLALVAGFILGLVQIRRVLDRTRRAEMAWASASGALGDLILDRFNVWGLTPAESEVAMLTLKGFSVAEVADLRRAAEGTVRAQLTRVYAKAGVSNRSQLLSLFMEDLLSGPLKAAPTAAPHSGL